VLTGSIWRISLSYFTYYFLGSLFYDDDGAVIIIIGVQIAPAQQSAPRRRGLISTSIISLDDDRGRAFAKWRHEAIKCNRETGPSFVIKQHDFRRRRGPAGQLHDGGAPHS
jgi:hypothetical protein